MILMALLASFSLQAWAKPEVRVRVQRAKQAIEVTGFGLRITPPGGLLAVSLTDGGFTKARITRNARGQWLVKWQDNPETLKYDSQSLSVRGQMLRLGVEPVPYDLEVRANAKRGMDAIARLDIDSYLAGVLPSEMPAEWPIEALKAQAVAARSFALRTAYERRNKHFDLDSTIMDQVYKFLNEAKDHPEWKVKIAKAISETNGEVLRDDNRRILKAFYSADCGCQTEDPKFVWGKVDALQSVIDPTCGQRKPKTWNLNLSKVKVRERLVAALNLPTDSTLRALQVAGKTPSGRVAQVVASMDSGEKRAQKFFLTSQEFRKIFGFEKIRSTDFKLKWLGNNLQINGTGMGHAVGLCQTGAKVLAENGMSYGDILKLYYPRVKLTRDKPSKPAIPRRNTVDQRSGAPA